MISTGAANSARLAVVPLERAGGQAQFIVRPTPASHTDLTPLLHWIEHRLAENLTVAALAAQATVSVRTLNRRFQELLGESAAMGDPGEGESCARDAGDDGPAGGAGSDGGGVWVGGVAAGAFHGDRGDEPDGVSKGVPAGGVRVA